MKSKFRKLFWIRLIFMFTFLVSLLFFSIYELLYLQNILYLYIVCAFFSLFFLAWLLYDLFQLFVLSVTEEGIEKIYIISKKKKHIPFNSISSIAREKVTLRNNRGNITDGYYFSILNYDKSSLIISPDVFENYDELMFVIKSNLKDLN